MKRPIEVVRAEYKLVRRIIDEAWVDHLFGDDGAPPPSKRLFDRLHALRTELKLRERAA